MNILSLLTDLSFMPHLSWLWLGLIATAFLILFGVSLWQKHRGAWWRLAASGCLLLALANPQMLSEERENLKDIAFIVFDETSSQQIDARESYLTAARETLLADIEGFDESDLLDVQILSVTDSLGGVAQGEGSLLMQALQQAAAQVPADQIAGAVFVTDGRLHDALSQSALEDWEFPAPIHHLNTGRRDEYDRHLDVRSFPSFGIVDEEIAIKVQVDDLGVLPKSVENAAYLEIWMNGGLVRQDRLPIGVEQELFLQAYHPGQNIVELVLKAHPDELTTRNNRAAFTVQIARDRLRVLMISGMPNSGGRAWRNLLKSDPAVDLVHFTILRRLEQQAGDTRDLSLIELPLHELFVEQIQDFDLIIFDQVANRAELIARQYFDNIQAYVRNGGGFLVVAGPEFSENYSLARTPLRNLLPAIPKGQSIALPFIPQLTEIGEKHPVTSGLIAYASAWPKNADSSLPDWGVWARYIQVTLTEGDVLMKAENDPANSALLLLRRFAQGRVALLASDTSWLWARGFDGGGPQDELLRRLAHWLMQEPELEEEFLTGTIAEDLLTIERRSITEDIETASIQIPSGEVFEIPLTQSRDGVWQGTYPVEARGLYVIRSHGLQSLVASGTAIPIEMQNPLSDTKMLSPLVTKTTGGSHLLRETIPELRRVSETATHFGETWIGLPHRNAYRVLGLQQYTLFPNGLAFFLAGLCLVAAWWRESR